MEFRLVVRGIMVGALAGVVAFLFGRVVAEPVIERAIGYEEGREAALHAVMAHEHGDVVSRGVQAGGGLGLGMVLFGVAMGALFAVVYCVCVGRVGSLAPGTLALLLAGGMFVALSLLPFLKYPANPPAVSDGETIGERTGLYLTMVVLSILLVVVAVVFGRYLRPKLGAYVATVVAGAAFIVAAAVVMALLPDVTEMPQPLRDASGAIVFPGFPAADLYSFRLHAVATQLILWTVIGVAFAPLAQRVLRGQVAVKTQARE